MVSIRSDHEVRVLRELALKVREICNKNIYTDKRGLWRDHNSLIKTRIPVYANVGMWDFVGKEVVTKEVLLCNDPLYRYIETALRCMIFKDSIGDDDIIEPWITIYPVYEAQGWGLEAKYISTGHNGGAYSIVPVITAENDLNLLNKPVHRINESKTRENAKRANDAIGDILIVNIERWNQFGVWAGDLSALAGSFMGVSDLLYSLHDKPDLVHKLMSFLLENIERISDETEKKGDYTLTSQYNQALTYTNGLPDPVPNSKNACRKELWSFFLSQEFTGVSPKMHDEFLLKYQMPLMGKFGLVAYGCCEDLTNKIEILKKIPNLRRIGISPWADVQKCADQIKDEYVFSWRPSPALTICSDWDPGRMISYVKDSMEKANGCFVDIILKDVQTVKGEVWRLAEWIKIVKDITSKY